MNSLNRTILARATTLNAKSTVTAAAGVNLNGDTVVGNAVTDDLTLTAAILGANPFIIDGNTDDTNERRTPLCSRSP